ncbi:MAG TPA: zinc ribbon domain-containing protein [Allosphingosinicella sp.]|nr:zinc ribbon domain-containing protein [Allosphingosinicella sp.]
MKSCPNCQEPLKTDAIVCTHCGHQFAPIPATPADGSRPTPDRQKIGCAILILSLVALVLWAFTSRYLEQSPEGAEAVKADPSADGRENGGQGR